MEISYLNTVFFSVLYINIFTLRTLLRRVLGENKENDVDSGKGKRNCLVSAKIDGDYDYFVAIV